MRYIKEYLKGGGRKMLEKKAKGIEYTVRGTRFWVKDNYQPSSMYIELGLYPNKIDNYNIKQNLIIFNLPLEDILSLHEWDNEREEINLISFLIRPLMKGNENKPQLCSPQKYEEKGDNFSDCELFSFVAWDHISWPGNDFYIGSRATDDGVKAAATDSMFVITGIEGQYNSITNKYDPPKNYKYWEEVII